MHWTRRAIAGMCAAAGILFLIINSVLLARGAMRWGLELYEKVAYAAVASTVPWVIAIMPFVVVTTLRQGKRFTMPTLWTLVGCTMWLAFAGYNIVGASGSIAFVRGDVVASRRHEAITETAAIDRRKALAAQRDAAGVARPSSALEPLIKAVQAQREWEWSQGCRAPQNNRERSFCQAYEKLRAELGSAQMIEKIGAEIAQLDERLAAAGPVAEAADPQAKLIAGWTGFSEPSVQQFLPLLTPLVLELGSMFLLGFAVLLYGGSHNVGRLHEPQEPRPLKPAQALLTHQELREDNAVLTRQIQLAEWFFRQCSRPVASGALPETDWYAHYVAICKRSQDTPLPLDHFRRIAGRTVPMREIDGVMYYSNYLPLIPSNAA